MPLDPPLPLKYFRDVREGDGPRDLSRLSLPLFVRMRKKLYNPPRVQRHSSSTKCSIAFLSHVFVSLYTSSQAPRVPLPRFDFHRTRSVSYALSVRDTTSPSCSTFFFLTFFVLNNILGVQRDERHQLVGFLQLSKI